MKDFDEMIERFKEAMPILERAAHQIGVQFEPPSLVQDDKYPRFRHKELTNGLAAYLKAVRIVSALNASIGLLERGFTEELGVLFRTIEEFFLDIVFLLAPQPGGGPSDAQVQFLEDFYQEEFSDPTNPLDSTQKRNRVPRKKVYAQLARTTVEFLNPSDGAEVHRTLSQALSGFVHGAYPHIMELYGGNPPHFHLNGMLGTPIHDSFVTQARNYYYRGFQSLLLLSQAFQIESIETELKKQYREFQERTGLGSDRDAASKIRNRRGGRP